MSAFKNSRNAIGILMVGHYSTKPAGRLASQSTFRFPVEIVEGTNIEDKLEEQQRVIEGDLSLVDDFIDAARTLEKKGVVLITSNCGFMSLYQGHIAGAVSVPVVTSSLIIVPLIHRLLKKDQKIAILTYSEKYLAEKHFEAVGWNSSNIPVVVGGMDGIESWDNLSQKTKDGRPCTRQMELDLVNAARRLCQLDGRIGALVLECTAFPPYAKSIQKQIRLPVFDITTLVTFIYNGVCRRNYPLA